MNKLEKQNSGLSRRDLLRKHGGKTGERLKIEDALIDAALEGNIEAVKQHLAAGADVNAKDEND